MAPNEARPRNALGLSYVFNGNMEKAEVQFRIASNRHGPEAAKAMNNIGMIRMGEGKFQAAADMFMAAMQESPGFMDAWGNLAIAYLKLDRTKDAVPLFEQYMASRRLNPQVMAGYAEGLFKTGETGRAKIVLQDCLAKFASPNACEGMKEKLK